MTVRLATFNVENLFARTKAFDVSPAPDGSNPLLAAFSEFNSVAGKDVYSDADKQAMLTALTTLKVLVGGDGVPLVLNPNPTNAFALLRENRGDFLKQPHDGPARIVASGRADWIGWVDLITAPVDETATRMTAKVINKLAPHILCVVEAEDRPSLARFNTDLLHRRYAHVMLVDGNDPRGIDVGLLTRSGIEIASVRSHVDDPDPASPADPLFSRDCPVYHLRLPDGRQLHLLLNHLKSQMRTGRDPDELRGRQSARVRQIYDQLRAEGAEFIAVLGDFNKGPTADDPPQHPTLEPLLGPGTPLTDAASLPVFDSGPRPGTFQSCGRAERIDYILLSPELAELTTAGGIFRRGLWGRPSNVHPPQAWEIFPEITHARQAASDHAAVWIDLDL
ncbi:endonuclease/exonuclease/phosphatase family protein [Goodfellowiella coeruleoviolacea]|uniref:Metal-dependent hydrolase, endonuclease/exonuclease/phosphatase family n=1 Tax=Goodfellowiella coeruleoviolacea TaxID=334858 RepID=A0AAE3G833_9PSEU|nr:endonuclease/exonuclease/phosphatase family protein [Goodfellowiella coeruleoviolacea]MCP2163382.1 Metal-dependent hydrolase, endonuclease/exonuclease/phosphatase family [Goodfellowiella coeruleoviolacea]